MKYTIKYGDRIMTKEVNPSEFPFLLSATDETVTLTFMNNIQGCPQSLLDLYNTNKLKCTGVIITDDNGNTIFQREAEDIDTYRYTYEFNIVKGMLNEQLDISLFR